MPITVYDLALGPVGAFLYREVFWLWLVCVLIALMFVAREIFRDASPLNTEVRTGRSDFFHWKK